MAASSGSIENRVWKLSPGAVLLFLLALASALFARIPLPPGTENVSELFRSAPFVFSGRVLSIDPRRHRSIEEDVEHFERDSLNNQVSIATFQVERWYKGSSQSPTVKLRFQFGSDAGNGHDCVDLRPSTNWLVMARQRGDGLLELSHDCEGGLPISAILATDDSATGIRGLQKDLIAGLQDRDPAMRLENVKRLGGLKLQSSSSALQPLVDYGSEAESRWATYAMFRAGDLNILQKAAELIEAGQGKPRSMPAAWMTVELRFLTGPLAVPLLIELAKSKGHSRAVRDSAIAALEEMRDPVTLQDLASHLNDSDRRIQFNSLAAMGNITEARECAAPRGPNQGQTQVAHQAAKCGKWWKDKGSFKKWPVVVDQ